MRNVFSMETCCQQVHGNLRWRNNNLACDALKNNVDNRIRHSFNTSQSLLQVFLMESFTTDSVLNNILQPKHNLLHHDSRHATLLMIVRAITRAIILFQGDHIQ